MNTPNLLLSRRTGRFRRLMPIVAIGASIAMAAMAQAGTVVSFRQGETNEFTDTPYTGVSDTMLRSGNSYNYGGSNLLTIGGNYSALIRFDLSSASGKVGSVSNAALTLSPRAGVETGDPISFSVYVLNPAVAGWQQGDKVGAESTEGEVSWRYLSRGATDETSIPWSGGSSFSSADYAPTPIFTGVFNPTSSEKVVIEIPEEILLGWINNPSSNAGLVIISNSLVGQSFYQSGYNTANLRPTLSLSTMPFRNQAPPA